jgi:GntR family transcriptional regulator
VNNKTDKATAAYLADRFTPANPDDAQPLYKQVQAAIREAIATRVLMPNDALPPERELAEQFEVSRITVRKAISGLVSEGVLESQHGSGTFVRSKV